MTVVVEERRARSLISDELFERLVSRIVTDKDIGRDLAERIMDQALAFLGTCAANRNESLTPSAIVDIGWHTFLLYTRDYQEFCARVAHRFIHHAPDDNPNTPKGGGDTIELLARTVDAIERAGYVVDTELWPITAGNCGPCHEEGNCAASGQDGNENTGTRTG